MRLDFGRWLAENAEPVLWQLWAILHDGGKMLIAAGKNEQDVADQQQLIKKMVTSAYTGPVPWNQVTWVVEQVNWDGSNISFKTVSSGGFDDKGGTLPS